MDRSAVASRPLLGRSAAAWCALAATALLSLALVAVLQGLGHAPGTLPRQERPRAAGPASLPLLARAPVSAALGSEEAAYAVAGSAAGLQAANPAQHLHARFGRAGVSVGSGALDENLRLNAVGYGNSLRAVGERAPSARDNRVLYARGGLSEWYVNGPLGVEQGFTVPRAPAAPQAGPLTLSIALSGNAHAALAAGGRSVTLSRPGAPSLRYGALAASDARGRALHSWLVLDGGRLLLRVDAAGARYPLHIDPLIEQARLEGGMSGEAHFGRSVALSANGSTALIGSPREGHEYGGAWIFTRSGSTWTEQARLEGDKAEGAGSFFGRGVALSGDGNTALIGDPGSEAETGAAWVFTRSGSTWTQSAKLVGAGETGTGQFGARVALSGDGTTALIGGFSDNDHVGAAWVFTGSGENWSQQAVLKGAGEIGKGEFGRSVALSSDGSTALVGGLENSFDSGAAWVFTRAGATWSQQAELQGAGESGRGQFGSGVALSAEGSTALIGASQDNAGAGAAWVFTRSGSSWTQQGEKLTGGSEEIGEASFGTSVALSAEGSTALVGAPDDNDLGAAWMFTRSGETWTQLGTKLTAGGNVPSALGLSSALSNEGNTALLGGLAANGGVGAAWVFAPPGPTVGHVQPGEGPLSGGTEVTITGTNFTNSSTVSFGAREASAVDVESPTHITATSPPPEAAGPVAVTVTTPGGISPTGPADEFTYDPVPAITALEGDEGPLAGGEPVTITGSGFTSSAKVHFGLAEATGMHFEGSTRMTVTAPAGAGVVEVSVTTAGGTSPADEEDLFTYDPIPTLAKIEPGEGPAGGGTAVKITGTGFTKASTVSFGGSASSAVTMSSPTELTARAPAGSGTVDVTVGTAGGTSAKSEADRFIYQPLPWIGTVAPAEGPAAGGTTVTITGENFTAASKVSFGSSPATGVKFNSEDSITATSPGGTGKAYVTVTTAGGTSPKREGAEFTYIPPTMLLIGGPPSGGVGSGTGVLPFFTAVLPPPQLGVSGNIAPVSGLVRVRLPGTNTFVLLSTLRQVPFGTIIDATNGVVSITTAGPHGGTQTGEFYDGEFVLTQGAKGVVLATLTGGSYSNCPTASERGHLAHTSSTHSSGKHVVRKLWANAHGNFTTKGTYAAGAVQGTEWLTEDLCDGTLIKVTRDKVKVTNLINHHTVEVTTGHSYLVRIP